MKKKILTVICMCMLGISVMAGCSQEKEPVKTEAEETKKEELKTIGEEKDSDYSVELTNKTGKNITGISIKLTDSAEYEKNMLENKDVYKNEESRILYYTVPEMKKSESTDPNAKVLEQGYDIQITFEDESVGELHSFPFEDIEKGEICLEDNVVYLAYTSVLTEEKIETKEAELAIIEQKKAEAEAQKQAEEAAAAAAEAQRQAEEAAAAEAQRQAEEAAAAAAAAEAQRQAEETAAENNYDSGSSSSDGCLDGGLLY